MNRQDVFAVFESSSSMFQSSDSLVCRLHHQDLSAVLKRGHAAPSLHQLFSKDQRLWCLIWLRGAACGRAFPL